jgi:hypothetical protein
MLRCIKQRLQLAIHIGLGTRTADQVGSRSHLLQSSGRQISQSNANHATNPVDTAKPSPKKTRPKARFLRKRETAYLEITRTISRHLLE